jgi:hypothetical protein
VAGGSLRLADHTAVSISGYVVGVADGTWIEQGVKDVEAGADTNPADVLPTHVILDSARELTLLAGFTWAGRSAGPACGAGPGRVGAVQPAGHAGRRHGHTVLGCQEVGLTEVSTTYLTGTLTGLVSSLASAGQDTPHGLRWGS